MKYNNKFKEKKIVKIRYIWYPQQPWNGGKDPLPFPTPNKIKKTKLNKTTTTKKT